MMTRKLKNMVMIMFVSIGLCMSILPSSIHAQDEIHYVSNETELLNAAVNGGRIQLDGDIEVTSTLIVENNLEIDFNNHFLTFTNGSKQNDTDILVKTGGYLSLGVDPNDYENGGLRTDSTRQGILLIGGSLAIVNGRYEMYNDDPISLTNNSYMYVSGGDMQTSSEDLINVDNTSYLEIKRGDFNNDNSHNDVKNGVIVSNYGLTVIKGGTFNSFYQDAVNTRHNLDAFVVYEGQVNIIAGTFGKKPGELYLPNNYVDYELKQFDGTSYTVILGIQDDISNEFKTILDDNNELDLSLYLPPNF